MAAFIKFNQFVEDLLSKVHDLVGTAGSGADAIKVYLTNAAPDAAADAVKTDLAEIATGNGYTGPLAVANVGSRSGGTVTVQGTSQQVVAAGGAVGPFRYVAAYNDTPTSPADPLVGAWDYGSALTLADGESFAIKFNGAAVAAAGTILTLA